MMKLLTAISFALLLGGCATYQISDEGGHKTIDVENTGWYLLSFIPIASGNPDRPNKPCCSLFSQTVTLENNMKILRLAMLKDGSYKANNVVSHSTDEKVMLILLKRYALHTSAELVK